MDSLTIEQVEAIKINRPEAAGKHWQGLSHGRLCRVMEEEFDKRGWTLIRPWYAAAHSGDDFAARWQLTTGAVDGADALIGLTTSNRRQSKLRLYSGVVVGDVPAPLCLLDARKHQSSLNVRKFVADGLDGSLSCLGKYWSQLLAPVSATDYRQFMYAAGRARLTPWSRLGQIDTSMAEFSYDCPKQWQLLLAFNRAALQNPPMAQLGQMYGFYRLLSPIQVPLLTV